MNTRTIYFKNGKVITVVGEVILYNSSVDKVRKTDSDLHYVNQEEVLLVSKEDSYA